MAFWVDDIAEQIDQAFPNKDEILIRDEKTASGRVHVGSLRGVVIHGVIAEALRERGRNATFMYEINDVDPMDGLPVYLDPEGYGPHMGKPLRHVPVPDAHGKPTNDPTPTHNLARVYGNEFVEVIQKLGFNAKIVWASDFYDSGRYNEWIEKVCAHPDEIREIYKNVSGSEKAEEWNPLQIVCENCGKVGSTTVTEFDGKEATYVCEPNKVAWAVGCGYRGKTSPFNGRGKLPWKVEWAVKWAALHVNVEGSGKDHNAAGGSRDVSVAICEKVLGGKVPFNIPYEFFLFGGAKMSASKGLGATAKEVSDMMTPELLRFLMVRTKPNQPIDFNIDGDTIPRLYDNHDECAAIYFGKETDSPDLGRAFYFAQLNPTHIPDRYFPRFSRIAFTVQIPHLELLKEVERMKGMPLTPEDKQEANERSEYAKRWLEEFAPESIKFEIQEEIPDKAYDLSLDQKAFLEAIAELLEGDDAGYIDHESERKTGEALHSKIHEIRKSSPLEARDAFAAIYAVLLGKDSGPQAGWFLEALDQDFLIERFQKVAQLPHREKPKIEDLITPLIILNKEVRERFPGIKVGFRLLEGITNAKIHPEFSGWQQEMWSGLDFQELKENSPRLEAFREIYRGFGVKPTNQKPSPVALISRLANGKPLPNINLVVDIYNTLAVKHQLAIGVFDLEKVVLPVTLKFAEGGELFQGLLAEKAVPLNKGELCYFDATGLVMARDFNYLDSDLTKVTEQTTRLLLNIDGNQACSLEEIERCLSELEEALVRFCEGSLGEKVLADAKV